MKGARADLVGHLDRLIIQQQLATIVDKLDAVNAKVDQILTGQLNDRLAKVKTGIEFYERALARGMERSYLDKANEKLIEGRNELILNIKSDIKSLGKDLPAGAKAIRKKVLFEGAPDMSRAKRIQESFEGALLASIYIYYVDLELGRKDPSIDGIPNIWTPLKPLEEMLHCIGVEGERIARWLPYSPQNAPEELWRVSRKNIEQLGSIAERPIEIDFDLSDILAD